MFIRRFYFLLILSLSVVCAQAQDSRPLISGQPVEREIAGGESHSYQILLTARQFIHIRLEQRTLDSALVLTAQDKQLLEVNLTGSGEEEPLSLEAEAGSYRLTVRGIGAEKMRGSYRLESTVKPTATELDRKYLTAQALMLAGQELTKQGPKTSPQVIEKLEQALPIWRELRMPALVALTLNKIGRAHFSLKQNEKAIAYYEQALTINRESKKRFGEAVVLNGLAAAYLSLRQLEKALETFEKSLAIYREVKDRRWEGLVILNLGNTHDALNQPEKAIASYEQAAAILREVKDQSFEARVLNGLGFVSLNQGKMEKAAAAFESAIAIFRELKDQYREGQTLINLATVHSRQGRSEKAVDLLNQALSLSRALKDRGLEGEILSTIGMAYGGGGQTEKAVDYFVQGLAISRELKDKRTESINLTNLGMAYQFFSQYAKAIEYLEQALPITRETGDRSQEGNVYSNLGTSYRGLGRFEKSMESYEQALAIHREVKYRLEEGNTLQHLGSVYGLLGRDDKAIEYYDQSLVTFREVKYRVGEANTLQMLGGLLERLGRFEDAIKRHEESLAIHRDLKYRLGEGSALSALGHVRSKLSQHEKALELFEQALAIQREVKSREGEGLTLSRIGEAKRQLGNTAEAAAMLTESVAIQRAIGNRNLEFGALTALARIERERGNLAKARTNVEESLRIAESLRAELVSPESRTVFLSGVQNSYQLYTDILMLQHKAEPTKGLDALAVEVSERQRARSLLDLLTEARADVRQGVDAALLERERLLGKQLSDKAQLLTQAKKPEQTAALKLEISQLENDYERARANIRKSSPHYASLVQPQPLKLNEIQRQLDPDTLLLEYALGEDRSYLWAITKDSLTSYVLPKEERIKQNALQVYEMLTARNTRKSSETDAQRKTRIAESEAKLPGAAQTLSQTLLAPAAAQLGGKRLVIIADGALQYIPFAMLPDPVAGRNQPLIVGHEVVSLPSASALAIQRTELAGRQPAPKMLAVIADPVFDRTDARVRTTAAETSKNVQVTASADTRGLEHIAEAADGETGRLVIRRLPFTRQEADGLLALTAKDSSFRAIDFQASRANVLSGGLSQYRYVHFATHGFLDTERPGLSSLVLSTVDEDGKPQNGFLRANDIYNMKLPAELVVLSACQTGLGKQVKGEGLVGLTRGFMYAGAKRVVVSLWSVNDKATSELMTKLYRGILIDNQPPAAALRAAQIEMWKQNKWESPYYWAAFTMQGEWR